MAEGIRIAKLIANSGFCSRRDAEKLIEQGKVKVNGEILKTAAFLASFEDVIIVSGKKLNLKPDAGTQVILFNKPRGCTCTQKDERARKTIYDHLPERFAKFHYVGRLDLNSEGLMLLTNSPRIKRLLELPQNEIERVYKVKVYGGVTPEILAEINKGVTIFDKKLQRKVTYKAEVKEIEGEKEKEEKSKPLKEGFRDNKFKKFDSRKGSKKFEEPEEEQKAKGRNSWIQFKLKEGKNREIRNICEHFQLQVARLKRVSFHRFYLKDLKSGAYEKLGQAQVDALKALDKTVAGDRTPTVRKPFFNKPKRR
jgi:23S rRNA pseudouridine2605 synthase